MIIPYHNEQWYVQEKEFESLIEIFRFLFLRYQRNRLYSLLIPVCEVLREFVSVHNFINYFLLETLYCCINHSTTFFRRDKTLLCICFSCSSIILWRREYKWMLLSKDDHISQSDRTVYIGKIKHCYIFRRTTLLPVSHALSHSPSLCVDNSVLITQTYSYMYAYSQSDRLSVNFLSEIQRYIMQYRC